MEAKSLKYLIDVWTIHSGLLQVKIHSELNVGVYQHMSFSPSANFMSRRVRAIINSTMMLFKHYKVPLSTAQIHIFKRESMRAG